MSPTTPEFFSLQVQEARRFYLDLAPPANTSLAVVCGGCEHCGADYAIRREDFPYCSIEFVAGGQGRLSLAGQTVPLLPGSVFVYGPGISQDITTDSQQRLVKYFVDFVGTRAERLLAEHALAPGTSGRVAAPGEVQNAFDELLRNGLRGTRFAPALCATLLEYLVQKIAESSLPTEAAQTPAYATYLRCRQYIQEHCLQLKSLAEIARRCHVDGAYLCRLFRRYEQRTPYQFLLRLKMNHAAELLQDGGTLVKQVAAELGFHDPFHFSRAFKSVFGLSPEAFRSLR